MLAHQTFLIGAWSVMIKESYVTVVQSNATKIIPSFTCPNKDSQSVNANKLESTNANLWKRLRMGKSQNLNLSEACSATNQGNPWEPIVINFSWCKMTECMKPYTVLKKMNSETLLDSEEPESENQGNLNQWDGKISSVSTHSIELKIH